MSAGGRQLSRIGPWQLAPEGAVIHPGERLAVVADVHLGYEWARGAAGDSIPAHSLSETLIKLARLLARTAIDRLVVAGDLVESPRPCRQTEADVATLTSWLADRGVALIALQGNHDPRRVPPLPPSLEVGGWTIAHGHLPISAPRRIVGHEHPVLRAGSVNTPCFLVSPRAIVLPAFTPNAAGCNVAASPGALPRAWRGRTLRCVVASASDWLDFGPLPELGPALCGNTEAAARSAPRLASGSVGDVPHAEGIYREILAQVQDHANTLRNRGDSTNRPLPSTVPSSSNPAWPSFTSTSAMS